VLSEYDETPGDRTADATPTSSGWRGAWSWVVWALVNSSERRMRAGWRLLVQGVLLILLSLSLSVPLVLWTALIERIVPGAASQLASTLGERTPLHLLAYMSSSLIAVVLSVWLARLLVDRRTFASLGLHLGRMAGRDVAVGFLIAAAMQATAFGVEWAAGWLSVEGFGWDTQALAWLAFDLAVMTVVFALVGFYEELLMRGYWLQNVADGLNRSWGVALSSCVFAVAHVFNPNASWVAAAGLVGAGAFLALAYVRTNSLWLPIGLHFGWNLFEGPVFGFPVSGITTAVLIEQRVHGPEVWTGGPFGPEAGLVQVASLGVGVAAVWLYTRRRGSSSPPARPPLPAV
jgi:membrane protease YdiL (CAAX protease family)